MAASKAGRRDRTHSPCCHFIYMSTCNATHSPGCHFAYMSTCKRTDSHPFPSPLALQRTMVRARKNQTCFVGAQVMARTLQAPGRSRAGVVSRILRLDQQTTKRTSSGFRSVRFPHPLCSFIFSVLPPGKCRSPYTLGQENGATPCARVS